MRKPSVFCFLAFSLLLVRVADCNYQALWDFDRNNLRAYVQEDFKIDLPHPIYFYGQKYSALHVSKDGMVAFGEDNQVHFKKHPQWPRGFTELTSATDMPFIAPFHHEGYSPANPSSYTGRIYYEQYSTKTQDQDITSEKRQFLKYLGEYLSHSSVTVQGKFEPDLYVMITWENVTDDNTVVNNDSCTATNANPCASATFQLVLAANEMTTFAIFNYGKMQVPYNEAHLAGMNGGKRRGWTDVVTCERTCVKQKLKRQIMESLPNLQGSSSKDNRPGNVMPANDIRGRFLFDVTDDIIVRGGCVPPTAKLGYLDTVEVYPPQVEMLGGQVIHVSGPCQDPYSIVYCRFGDKIVTQGKISAGMVGWCPVPRLTSRGHVKLEVSPDTSHWYLYTYVIVVPPDNTGRWSDEPSMQPWFQTNPNQLRITWNPQELSGNFEDFTVDIVLVQYKEQDDKVEWRNLQILEEKYRNTGSYVFDPRSDIRFTCQTDCDDVTVGLVDIRLSEEHKEAPSKRQYISIGPLPLGWYVNRIHTENIGEDWPRAKCEEWAEQERQDTRWQNDLPPCPCSLQQALADWGRWQADASCSMLGGERLCSTNRQAKHCVRSVHPTAQAAGSHCCYDNDNNLMYSGDSYHGSTSSRAHAWGASPYQKAGTVPSMSHWLHDLVPYYQCCRWTNDEQCQYYTDYRPTKGCRTYDPPGAAQVYGDPHVETFDGEQYHFGGAGDFWLVQSPHLNVHARFLERESDIVEPEQNYLMPTYISSVAIAGEPYYTDVVIFTLAPPNAIHHHRLDVKVNRRHFSFDDGSLSWQDFRGLSVINTAFQSGRIEDMNHSNFTVLVKGGAGVQVAERNGLLHVVVLLPPFVKDESNPNQEPASKGLLGTWDEQRFNEYLTPAGQNIPAGDMQDENVKNTDFAAKWAVQEDDDLLFQFNHHDLRLPRTGPLDSYTKADKRPDDAIVTGECGARTGATHTGGGSSSSSEASHLNPCAHDYYVTGNRTIARATRKAQEDFESMRRSQRKIWSCGWLDIPFAVKDHTNYSAGNTLRVTGCRQGVGSTGSLSGGPTQYTCVQNQTDHQPFWEPNEVNRYLCLEDVEGASIGMIIGIVAAVVVVIIIIAVVAFILYRRRNSKKIRMDKRASSARADATMDPGTDETLIKKPIPSVRMSEIKNPGEPV